MAIYCRGKKLTEEKHLYPEDVYHGAIGVVTGWIGDLVRRPKLIRIRGVTIRPQDGVVQVDSLDGNVSVSGGVINDNTLCQRLGITFIGVE